MRKILQKIEITFVALLCICAMPFMTMKVQAGAADNSLSSLTLSEGTLSPTFEGSKLNYTAQVSADTTSVDVSAKTVNPAASVVSITGNTNLSEGTNVISVLVQAENGNQATYKITVTRGGSTAGTIDPGTSDNAVDTTDNSTDTADNDTGTANQGTDTDDAEGSLIANADGYTVSDSYKAADIPTGFTETQVTYQDNACTGFVFDKGAVTLLYMTNEAGDGAFFVYDSATGETYPYVRLTSGDRYIVLLKQTAGEGYAQANLTIGDVAFSGAYQFATGDFYQVYAINSDGVEGWYQYDASEGTYQRYEMTEVTEEDTDNSNYLQQAYSDLNDQYTARKERDLKIIAVLIVILVILVFVIVNLLLRGKKSDSEDEEDIFEEKPKKIGKQKDAVGQKKHAIKEEEQTFDKNVYENNDEADETAEEVEKSTVKKHMAEKTGAEAKADKKSADTIEDWEDDEEFEDFDEEPGFFSGKKREPKERKKKERKRKSNDIFDDDEEDMGFFSKDKTAMDTDISDDDDLEVMDLNDL